MNIFNEKTMRAEEIIAEIYRQKREFLENGRRPNKVALSMEMCRILSRYRETLGVMQGPVPDYLLDETVFGLTICVDTVSEIKVCD